MDKVIHFIIFTALYVGLDLYMPALLALILTILAAALKEWVYDKLKHGKPDLWDFVASIVGPILIFTLQTL